MIHTIQVTDTNSHPAKTVMSEVSDVMSDLGYDNDLIAVLSGEEHVHERDVGLTLKVSSNIDKTIRHDTFPFSLQEDLSGYFGKSFGSANVTTLKQNRELTIRETLSLLDSSGQLSQALDVIEMRRTEDDPDAVTILTYALATYAKGWFAEEMFDLMKKGSVSADKGGIDGYVNSDMVQMGSITRWNSKKKQMESSDIRHLLYQWTSDGKMVIGDPEEVLSESKKIAKSEGLSATLIRRSAGNLKINQEVGRSFRYLWW